MLLLLLLLLLGDLTGTGDVEPLEGEVGAEESRRGLFNCRGPTEWGEEEEEEEGFWTRWREDSFDASAAAARGDIGAGILSLSLSLARKGRKGRKEGKGG